MFEDKAGKFAANGKEKIDFIAYMGSIEKSSIRKKIMTFLPNISNGKVVISKDSSVTFDFDFEDRNERSISFSKYMTKIKNLFRCLKMTESRYYLLIDEIDPRIGGGHLFQLDLILIRDLIIAVKKLNMLFPREQRGFTFVAAVRSEVLDSVSTLGKEIHKILEQFGVNMNWGELSAVSIRHPLVKMVAKKVIYSERKAGIIHHEATDPESYVWSRYFKKNKEESLDVKELLDFTWMRPETL